MIPDSVVMSNTSSPLENAAVLQSVSESQALSKIAHLNVFLIVLGIGAIVAGASMSLLAFQFSVLTHQVGYIGILPMAFGASLILYGYLSRPRAPKESPVAGPSNHSFTASNLPVVPGPSKAVLSRQREPSVIHTAKTEAVVNDQSTVASLPSLDIPRVTTLNCFACTDRDPISLEEAMVKMKKNATKAVNEHIEAFQKLPGLYKTFFEDKSKHFENAFQEYFEEMTPEEVKKARGIMTWKEFVGTKGGAKCEASEYRDWCKEAWEDYRKIQETYKKVEATPRKENPYEDIPAASYSSSVSSSTYQSISISYAVEAEIGTRDTMEDAPLYKETEEGILLGVFDGHIEKQRGEKVAKHAGKQVAEYAAKAFGERFFDVLKEESENVHKAFGVLIHQIHTEVASKEDWDAIGSTVVVSFIDKKTLLMYTVTLGDSEANIYRKNAAGKMKSIPVSVIRDWSSEKDKRRAEAALPGYYKKLSAPLKLTVSNGKFGISKHRFEYRLNVSRVVGDKRVDKRLAADKEAHTTSVMSHKGKITVKQLQPGDIVTLACDGLKDFCPESRIVELVQSSTDDVQALASTLVHTALNEGQSSDNITVQVLKISPK